LNATVAYHDDNVTLPLASVARRFERFRDVEALFGARIVDGRVPSGAVRPSPPGRMHEHEMNVLAHSGEAAASGASSRSTRASAHVPPAARPRFTDSEHLQPVVRGRMIVSP